MHRWENGHVAWKATVTYFLGYVFPFALSSGRAYNALEMWILGPRFMRVRRVLGLL